MSHLVNQPWNKHHQDSISKLLHKFSWLVKGKQIRFIFLFEILNIEVNWSVCLTTICNLLSLLLPPDLAIHSYMYKSR